MDISIERDLSTEQLRRTTRPLARRRRASLVNPGDVWHTESFAALVYSVALVDGVPVHRDFKVKGVKGERMMRYETGVAITVGLEHTTGEEYVATLRHATDRELLVWTPGTDPGKAPAGRKAGVDEVLALF